MASTQLNLMMFVNSHARIIVAKSIDYHTGDWLAIPQDLKAQIYAGSPLLSHSSETESISGLLLLPNSPIMLVVSVLILTSAGEGPSQGALIFGRFLDEKAIEHLGQTTRLGVKLQVVDDPKMPDDFRAVLPTLTEGSPLGLRETNPTTMASYVLLKDVYGKIALALKVEIPRDTYARGQQTIQYFILALLVGGLVFGAVITVLLEKLVLLRLARLKSDVVSIEANSVTLLLCILLSSLQFMDTP